MKAILEFSFPEDEFAHQIALDGQKWRDALMELDQYLRDKIKYSNDEDINMENVRELIRSYMAARNLTFNQ